MKTQWLILLVLLMAALTTGCGGGTTVQASNTTMGQELQDLDASFKKGIITKQEYERAKEDILERYKY